MKTLLQAYDAMLADLSAEQLRAHATTIGRVRESLLTHQPAAERRAAKVYYVVESMTSPEVRELTLDELCAQHRVKAETLPVYLSRGQGVWIRRHGSWLLVARTAELARDRLRAERLAVFSRTGLMPVVARSVKRSA